jgi:hypothetical protein
MEMVIKRHLLESLRWNYHRVGTGKKAKGEILREVQVLRDCHRTHAIRAMRISERGKGAGKKRGRKSKYGTALSFCPHCTKCEKSWSFVMQR